MRTIACVNRYAFDSRIEDAIDKKLDNANENNDICSEIVFQFYLG